MNGLVPVQGVCRTCGCTDWTPCVHVDMGPCTWADDSRTLCTFCDGDHPLVQGGGAAEAA